jgi:hypothetical protein
MSSFVSAITSEVEKQLEVLRSRKGLKLVTPDHEGTPLGALPDGTYGFTYSPVNESTPLYAKRLFQCFEIHRVSDADVHLIGFATPQEEQIIRAGTEPLDFRLYPEPNGASGVLVEISLERVERAKPVSRSEGNYMPISLNPG